MFKLKAYKNQKINAYSLVQILFYAFPLVFIIGNLIVSLHLVLFICASLFLIKKKNLSFRFSASHWIFIIFFVYVFLLTIVQFEYPGLFWSTYIPEFNKLFDHDFPIESWYHNQGNPVFKAFYLFRFLILVFVIDTLYYNKILDIKKFFFSCFICTSFVSLDIILQYITGRDLFGFERKWQWSSGPFDDELIAGTYLKNFFFFSFFYFFQNTKNKNISLLVFIVVLHLVASLASGNRMPMILLLFGCFIIFLFIKNLRIIMLVSVTIFLSIFLLLAQKDPYIKKPYQKIIANLNIYKAITVNKNKEISEKEVKKIDRISDSVVLLRQTGHNRVIRTAIQMIKERPLTGFGLKSFRWKCAVIIKRNNDVTQDVACGNHPHNYYFEVLSETGIIGLSLLILLFIYLIKDSFKYLFKNKEKVISEKMLLIPILISFFLEIWPIKSTGSFFTTWNATFFWLNVSILYAFLKYKNKKY